MRLAEALRVRPGTSVAFTGAGGKSSSLQRLAEELAPQGPVILTTTTRLGKEQSDLAHHHLVLTSPDDLESLSGLLDRHGTVLVTGPLDTTGAKWAGLVPAEINALYREFRNRELKPAAGSDHPPVILIEADGARGRSLKAPAEHEPAVPEWADVVVPVVGMDALGETIGSDLVHRGDVLGARLGLGNADRISGDHIAALLMSPIGGLKGIPGTAEARILLNKVDTDERWSSARAIAEQVLREPRVAAVALASVLQASPVAECWGRVAGVVLAAGGSSRLGRPKQLIEWRGRALAWHAARTALDAGLSPVVVVTGAGATEVGNALSEQAVEIVYNPRWQGGQSTSVRAGVEAVIGRAEAICFLLSDMPRVPPDLIQREVETHRRTLSPIVAPWAGGRWANPALFDRAVFQELLSLRGDRGGRALFDRYPVLRIEWDESILLDVDTPEDLERLERLP
ncbi:MAG: selenium cofactor biosynthesis protein YqeC [Anaerolineales bacterium]